MTNLPPGVTGREDAFGEQRAATEPRTCAHPGEVTVYAKDTVALLERLAPHTRYGVASLPAVTIDLINLLFEQVRDVDLSAVADVECPWEGYVEVKYWNHRRVTWTCPLCNHLHEEEAEDD